MRPSKVWNLPPQGEVSLLGIAPDESRFLLGKEDSVSCHELENGKKSWEVQFEGGSPSATFEPRRNTTLISGGKNPSVRELKLPTGETLWQFSPKGYAIDDAVFVPNSPHVLTTTVLDHRLIKTETQGEEDLEIYSGGERMIHLWEYPSGRRYRQRQLSLLDVKVMAFSLRHDSAFVAGDGDEKGIIEHFSMDRFASLGRLQGEYNAVWELALIDHHDVLIGVDKARCCAFGWNLPKGTPLGSIHFPDGVFAVCPVGDLPLFAAANQMGGCTLVGVPALDRLSTAKFYETPIISLISSPRTPLLLSSDESGQVALWRITP